MFSITQEATSKQPTEIVVHYNEDPPGSGKSEFYKRLVVEEPGRYLLAVPTQRLLDEHAHGRDGLRARIAAAGLPPSVEVVRISSRTHQRSVRRALAEAPGLHAHRGHVVVACTHAALTTTDLSGFAGWTLLIDEVPDAVACGTWKTGASLALFGVDAEAVRRSREFETVLQFVSRCAVRRPEFGGTCFWNVYDGGQARFLQSFMEEHGLAEAELRYVDVGIGDVVRPQKRPKLVGEAAAARDEKRRKNNTERVRAHRERKRAKKVASGAYRGRGRPRKATAPEPRP